MFPDDVKKHRQGGVRVEKKGRNYPLLKVDGDALCSCLVTALNDPQHAYYTWFMCISGCSLSSYVRTYGEPFELLKANIVIRGQGYYIQEALGRLVQRQADRRQAASIYMGG